jgi:hypothetical protein
MRGNIFVILIIAGLLLFGCTGPSAPPAGGQGGAANATGGAMNQTQQQAQGQAQEQTQGQAQEQAGAGASGGTGSSGETGGSGSSQGGSGTEDLAGQTFEALAGLGVPLVCDISVTSEGKTTNMKVYMKGSDEVRSEFSTDTAECPKMISIMKGNSYYSSCESGEIMPGCKWMQVDFDPETAGTTSGAGEPPDYTDVPPAKINCVPWVYDASKFAVSGKVCNLNDMMQGYGQGGYPGMDD